MNIRLIPGAPIISGLIAVAVPSNLSLAQSNDVGLSTPKNMMAMQACTNIDIGVIAGESIRTTVAGGLVRSPAGLGE